jgi:hypothetical protein
MRTKKVLISLFIVLLAFLTVSQVALANIETNPPSVSVLIKNLVTSFDRLWNWTIDKVGDQSSLTLSTGQSYIVNYAVTLSASAMDSNQSVSGKTAVFNQTSNPVYISEFTDTISPDISVPLDCPFGGLPFNLPAGWIYVCDFSSVSLPDSSPRTMTAVAIVDGQPLSAVADVIFTTPTNQVDECVDVTDDRFGFLGTVCAGDPVKTFNYSLTVGPYQACGVYEYTNTASFVTNDTGATGSDSWTVDINVPCDGGCTLTPGYWKTHSEFGPAPYDDTWARLSNGASTPFYLSGQTYYQVLWTPPSGGNAYYNLAHPFIAAKLNLLNGAASTPEVDAALAWAENFFNTYTPGSLLPREVRNQAISYAMVLDNYNNGLIGPGHCSE